MVNKTLLNSKWNSLEKQPFIDNSWRFGFDWSLRRNGLKTVPTKAPVKAEMSTIINKRCFSKAFHFELVYRSTYEYI